MANTTKLVIVLSPLGPVIGNLLAVIDDIQVQTPRLIQTGVDKSGRGTIGIMEILGKPKVLSLPKQVWWDVEDEELKKHYIEATTGLVLAKPNTVVPFNKMN